MAYQPLYGSLRDNVGGFAHTLVLRGKVDSVGFSLNSQLGEVMSVGADGGEYNSNHARISECKSKLEEYKDNQKKVAEWTAKLEEAQRVDTELRRDNKVHVGITVHEPTVDGAEFIFNLNGIRFSAADLKLLQYYKSRDMLGLLSIASAFALIPDMKRLIEEPTEENQKAFIEKRTKLEAFFTKEEADLKAEYCEA